MAKSTTTPTPDTDPVSDAVVAEGTAAPSTDLALGESAFLTAVHGLIVHPFTGLVIDIGTPTKVDVDPWVLMQYTAGKLAKA